MSRIVRSWLKGHPLRPAVPKAEGVREQPTLDVAPARDAREVRCAIVPAAEASNAPGESRCDRLGLRFVAVPARGRRRRGRRLRLRATRSSGDARTPLV